MSGGGSAEYLTQRQKADDLMEQMRQERESWRSQWLDLASFIEPTRARMWLTDSNRGDRRNYKIIDPTASLSARTLASGMMSGVTNPARPWFRLTTPDADLSEFQTVKDWLYEVTLRMQTVLSRSNFYDEIQIAYGDLGVFGTSATMMEEDEDDVVRFQSFPVGSYFIADDEYRRVRYFGREFEISVSQCIEMFGEDNPGLSTATRQLYEQNSLRSRVQINHLVMPNPDHDASRDGAQFAPFVSYYWEKGAEGAYGSESARGFLRVSGYREFPILAGRWAVTGEDTYATNCPGMMVIGDVRQLQLMEKRKLQALDKKISPPVIAPTGLRNQQMSFAAGGVTFNPMPNQPITAAYAVDFNAQEWNFEAETVRYRIRRGMFEDLFLMLASNPNLDRGQKTAREIEERHEEKLLALGPVLERLNTDILDPLTDRLFAVLLRKGMLPEIPPELEGVELKVEYISIMAAAQKLVGVGGLERYFNTVTNLAAATGDMSILDVVNFDEGLGEYGENLGIPPLAMRSLEEIQAIRASRAEAQAEMQRAEQAKLEADALAKMSQAKIGSGEPSVLSQLMGEGGGVPSTGALPVGVV